MPGFLTDLVNNQILDCYFGGSVIVPPATLYVGLSLSRARKGGRVTEPEGGSYARVAVANDPAHFRPALAGTKSNARPITFGAPSRAWGSILSVFIADSPAEGNVLAVADLPAARVILGGEPAPTIAVDALFLSHD